MPEQKIWEDGFSQLDIEASNQRDVVVADGKFQQALSFLFGWIPTKKRWKPILSDVDGRLLVSTSPTKSNSGIHSNPAMSTSSGLVLAENADRKVSIIQNPLGVSVFLSFDGGDAVVTDFELGAGQSYIDDVYYGKITGILASGSGNLNVVEMS